MTSHKFGDFLTPPLSFTQYCLFYLDLYNITNMWTPYLRDDIYEQSLKYRCWLPTILGEKINFLCLFSTETNKYGVQKAWTIKYLELHCRQLVFWWGQIGTVIPIQFGFWSQNQIPIKRWCSFAIKITNLKLFSIKINQFWSFFNKIHLF